MTKIRLSASGAASRAVKPGNKTAILRATKLEKKTGQILSYGAVQARSVSQQTDGF